MKKFLLSTAVLALSASSAIAADLPSRKAESLLPPPPPPPMWTGFYAGLNAGYGFGTNSNTQSVGFGNPASFYEFGGRLQGTTSTGLGQALSAWAPMNQNGFIGGGQIGYNYQWGSNIVVGIEADMQGTGIRGTSRGGGVGVGAPLADGFQTQSFSSIGGTRVNAGVDWMGTVRGRIGYLWTPTMLLYATGGLTYGGVYANVNNYAVESYTNTSEVTSTTQNATYTGGGTRSQTLVGWNVGGGLEWMFMPNWSLKAEGTYWNMGSQNVATAAYSAPLTSPNQFNGGSWGTTGSIAPGGTRVNYQGVIARMGVNYHFNFGGSAPIVAKY